MKMKTGRYGAAAVLLAVSMVALSGCATKKFVRNEVGKSASEITAKMEAKDSSLQQGITENSNQIEELGGKASEQSRQIAALDTKVDTGLSAVDQKVGQAQSAANQAATDVNRLEEQFQNRNQYTTKTEQTVLFKSASAKILDEQLSTLDQIAQQVKTNPDAILVLEGRADSIGTDASNTRLSDQRVETVLRYLVANKEVPTHRVYKMGLGEARPVAANDTAEGRAQNRSVTLRVLTPGGNSGQMSSNASR